MNIGKPRRVMVVEPLAPPPGVIADLGGPAGEGPLPAERPLLAARDAGIEPEALMSRARG